MPEHKGSTDSVHKVDLASAIQRASWGTQSIMAGEHAGLEVYTLFVGDGSDIKVEIRTKSGQTVGKIQGKVGQNRYQGIVQIPKETTEDLYFEARLPKHGLTGRSNLLRVFPRWSISNARWDRQEARRTDVIKLSADTRGIPDGTDVKISIYENDADGAHDLVAEFGARVQKNRIEIEWEYEYHADTDEIPSKEESEKGYNPPEYFFEVRVGAAVEKSGLLKFKDWIEIELLDADGNPIPDTDYILHLPDGTQRKGRLDAKGRVLEKDVAPGRTRVKFPNLTPPEPD